MFAVVVIASKFFFTGGLACKLEGIIESPLVNGYHNKCEFTVGYSQQGKPTVGFLLGNFREGVTAVEEPSDCPNVSRISCKYAEVFQNFLQNSTFSKWNRMSNTGFWRQLTVREGRRQGNIPQADFNESNIAEVLLMVQAVFSFQLPNFYMNYVIKYLILYTQISSTGFENEAFVVSASTNSPSLPLKVLVVQDHQGVSNVPPADAPLRSLSLIKSEAAPEARIQDYINNLRFCISPTAFFQVVGIEINASAVADANRNAEINGIKNCRFVYSKAEDVLGSLLKGTKEYLTKEPDGNIGNKEDTSCGV